jgi:hypothetical protein
MNPSKEAVEAAWTALQNNVAIIYSNPVGLKPFPLVNAIAFKAAIKSAYAIDVGPLEKRIAELESQIHLNCTCDQCMGYFIREEQEEL